MSATDSPSFDSCPSSLNAALEQLPHGAEFRFVDELLELQPSTTLRARYRVPEPEQLALLKGHFPAEPLLPGVVLIEMIAQCAGVLWKSSSEGKGRTNIRLAAVKQAKILAAALPKEELEIAVEPIVFSQGLAQFRGSVTRGGQERIAEAQVVLASSSAE